MADKDDVLSDDVEDEDGHVQKEDFENGYEIVSNGTPLPFDRPENAEVVAGFAIEAEILGNIVLLSALKKVAKSADKYIPGCVEIFSDRIALSAESDSFAMRVHFKTGTYVASSTKHASFTANLKAISTLCRYSPGCTLQVYLLHEQNGLFLKIKEFHKTTPVDMVLQIPVENGTVSELLTGERSTPPEDVKAKNLSKALKICSAARPLGGLKKCEIEIGSGLATGISQEIGILLRDPALSPIGTVISPKDARKGALPISYMERPQVVETRTSSIIYDDRIEVAFKKGSRPSHRWEIALSRHNEQAFIRAPMQGFWDTWLVDEVVRDLAKVSARRGDPSPPVQLAEARIADGKLVFELSRRSVKAITGPQNQSATSSPADAKWGLFDLSSLIQVWVELQDIRHPQKEMVIATCGNFLKLKSVEDGVEAYFPYHQAVDPRFRNN